MPSLRSEVVARPDDVINLEVKDLLRGSAKLLAPLKQDAGAGGGGGEGGQTQLFCHPSLAAPMSQRELP